MLAHASLQAIGPIEGGAETLVRRFRRTFWVQTERCWCRPSRSILRLATDSSAADLRSATH